MNSYTQQDRRALVLFGGGGGGGGGARACCQGGVLRAIAGILPKKTINPLSDHYRSIRRCSQCCLTGSTGPATADRCLHTRIHLEEPC